MLLTKLTFEHFGPFSHSTELRLERDMTVITGANDTGKSSLLALIDSLCGAKPLAEEQVNIDRHFQTSHDWKHDDGITCDAEFQGTDYSSAHTNRTLTSDDIVFVRLRLAPEVQRLVNSTVTRKSESAATNVINVKSWPTAIRLSFAESLSSQINLAKPNERELQLLQAAFGPEYSYHILEGLSPPLFSNRVSAAEAAVNQKIRKLLPDAISFELKFTINSDNRELMMLNVHDSCYGHTPLTLRGQGVQRIVSALAQLLCIDTSKGHFIVVLDEPENSLHPDAQRSLRRFLEELATKPNIQVVYATHSPCMINTLRPTSLRLLRREIRGDRATSVIDNEPIKKNFQSVRSCLGMSLTDTLALGPIGIVVEGATEIICLPQMLLALEAADVAGFEAASSLLDHCHLIDGKGDSYSHLCDVVKGQGAKPIIFLDGDKRDTTWLRKVQEKHRDVPVVLFTDREEFEQLIPEVRYLAAVNDWLHDCWGLPDADLTPDTLANWLASANLPNRMVFTKRIDRWIHERHGVSLDKPNVLRRAFELTLPTEIRTESLLELLTAIRNLIRNIDLPDSVSQ